MNAEKMRQPKKVPGFHPFRAAVFRGLAVVLPPLLTIVIFLWVGGTVQNYVLEPVTVWSRNGLAWSIEDVRPESDISYVTVDEKAVPVYQGIRYHELADESYVPDATYEWVQREEKARKTRQPIPQNSQDFYRRYVELKYLQPEFVVPFFLALFIFVLYLLGKFMAAGIGRMFWGFFERGIHRVPLVRNVYSSVKQVSDFMLSQQDVEYSRVVAVEWPRKGIWSLGLVTGESLRDLEAAANEPVVSVLVCTSPMPMTGFTVTVRKSETVDLDITIDQAFQFIVSCGVVVPPHQMNALRTPEAPPSRNAEEGDRIKIPASDAD